MLGFEKLARNARGFRMLTGMSLQKFVFLFAKAEKVYREEARKRLPKLGSGNGFSCKLG